MKREKYLALILGFMILFIPFATSNFGLLFPCLGRFANIEEPEYLLKLALETIALITTNVVMIVLLLKPNVEETLFRIISGYTIILGFCLVVLVILI